MLLKRLSILFFGLVIAFFAFSGVAYATSELSTYVNLYKGDTYDEAITIEVNTTASEYLLGVLGKASYDTVPSVESPSLTSYGFKVNGEFTIDTYEISENGTYYIEVMSYYTSDNIIYPSGISLESFYIYIELADNVTLTKTYFSPESYSSADDFITDVSNSFNYDIYLTLASRATLRSAYNTYLEDLIETDVTFTITYNSRSYNFTITLCSESVAGNDIVDIETSLKSLPNLAFKWESIYTGSSIESVIIDVLEDFITDFLNLPTSQSISVTSVSNISYPTSLTNNYTIITDYLIEVSDNTNQDIYKSIDLLFYNDTYVKTSDLYVDFSDVISQNGSITAEYTTYLMFSINRVNFYDYYNTPTLLITSINEERLTLTYTLNYETKSTTSTIQINEIEEVVSVRLITNYNYIVKKSSGDTSFRSQIGILIDNVLYTESSYTALGYTITTNAIMIDDEEYLEINLYDEAGDLIDTDTRLIVVKGSDNWFIRMFIAYGNFLRNIF